MILLLLNLYLSINHLFSCLIDSLIKVDIEGSPFELRKQLETILDMIMKECNAPSMQRYTLIPYPYSQRGNKKPFDEGK